MVKFYWVVIMKSNFHSHTYLCGHASGKPIDYIEKAISEGFDRYGIADHAYLPEDVVKRRGEYPWLKYQMEKSDFSRYLSDINEAILIFGNQIEIYKGLEVEFSPNHEDYYQEMLKDLDYLILGIHFIYNGNAIMGTRGLKTKEELELYCQNAVLGMGSGYFKILAHPDIFMYSNKCFDEKAIEISRKIIEAAIKNDVILEINGAGLRKGLYEGEPYKYYPVKDFWKLVSEYKDAKVVIGLDSHNVVDLTDSTYQMALDLANECNIKLYEITKKDLNNKK